MGQKKGFVSATRATSPTWGQGTGKGMGQKKGFVSATRATSPT
jgi:hypothetical protein